ncbi:MAG: hypothetical protein RR620_08740 [Clostridium sp.]
MTNLTNFGKLSVQLEAFYDEEKNSELRQDIHMKLINREIKHEVYKVIYSYKTKRGNIKENHKYVISEDSEDATFKFLEHINEFNKEYPYRAILNVKILKVTSVGNLKISL